MSWTLNLVIAMITISSYYKDKMNALRLDLPGLAIWCSYNTPIAFRYKATMHVSENLWQTTTGKHITEVERNNMLNKKDRMSRPDFEAALNKALKEVIPGEQV